MYIRAISRAALLCSTILSFNAIAAGDRADYDLDDDGLIEINDLADLNEIRNHLDGAALYGESTGCPEEGCNGFELTADLDFDTNGDGQMNELDTYWNDGEGWEPIGSSSSNAFTADFHGNGHQIRNLYIDRTGNAGLFGGISGTPEKPVEITMLIITGKLKSRGSDGGMLVGEVKHTTIDRVFISGSVRASWYAGGLAGETLNSTVSNVLSSVNILTGRSQGGLIGRFSSSTLANSLSTGYVENGYGLLGYSYNSTNANLHWATDTSGQETSRGTNASYFGALLSELQCPTLSDNNTCTDRGTLFESWSSEVWDFGTGQQLPGLIMGGRIYRDSDGDGSLDEDDAYPGTFAASLDTDEDGYIDSFTPSCDASCRINSGLILDAFPSSAAAYLDADLDGLVDEWADGCDATCQTNSGLTYDDYPDDRDNDGITNAVDTDDNNDGITDADADSDGLIDIASLEELSAIRFALDGSGQVMTEESLPDTSGCPIILWQGTAQQRCHGYELISDLDFDTNGDGQMNELDTYWNDGEGWEPIGPSYDNFFSGSFNGNGHQIRNLYIDNRSGNAGLFGYVEGTSNQLVQITQVAITGPLTSITGRYDIGVLAGAIQYAKVDRVFVSGAVNGGRYVGGLAGTISDSIASNVSSSASILTGGNLGGLIGRINASPLANSLSTGFVANGYGLLRYSNNDNNAHLYWATDTSGQATSAGTNASYFGALLSELQCPTSSDNNTCTDKGTLYESWSSEVWDFGTGQQLPGLIMSDRVYRDSDGDGALDEDDAYPDIFAASLDTDEDGYPDNYSRGCDSTCAVESELSLDAFPENSSGGLDADLDGLVDEWADNCDTTCQANSGLSYDNYPDDHDNDGITDAVDTDDNNDGILDADADSDGLIDIASLEELNAIRFALDGSGQAMIEGSLTDTSGCPIILWQGIAQQRCHGYELVSDLDFDTNGDGQMNELDTYWNDGEGWKPIGSFYSPFSADFHGNGHQIRNLYIDKSGNIGLFSYITGTPDRPATINQLAIIGPLTSITDRMTFSTGINDAGILVARVSHAEIDSIFVTGIVDSPANSGGLAAVASNSAITNIFSSAGTLTGNNQGGLIGYLSRSTLYNSLSTGYADSDSGLLSHSDRSNNESLYWAINTSGQTTSASTNVSYFGALLSELQCPTTPDDDSCTDKGTLYENWDSDVWDFGTQQQLPALVMGNRIYRDSDGDGVLDKDDAFPDNFAASIDIDGDRAPDRWTTGCDAICTEQSELTFDAFPSSAAAHLDGDLDGLVDEWADDCDVNCQANSGLTFDDYPGDRDNDGIHDTIDTDDNNDGIIDADIDSNGLIDVASLEELNAIRFALDGSGQVMIEGGLPDTSGCPVILRESIAQQRCRGYELVSDLDFDTNGDGQMNELDTYWNNGEGWEPIGFSERNPFSSSFDGKGHQIRNTYSVSDSYGKGLFGYATNSVLSNLVLNGPLTRITGRSTIGILAGKLSNSSVYSVYTAGDILASDTWSNAGGVAGIVSGTSLQNIQSATVIEGTERVGGVVGFAYSGARITRVIATGEITGPNSNSKGGIVGIFLEPHDASSSYWATDTSGQATSTGSNTTYFGALLNELQCPTTPDDDSCTDKGTLYENWDSDVWDFGSDRQLPGLIMNGVVYRDSDGDGTLDVNLNAPSVALILTQAGREEATIVEGMGDVTIEAIISDEDDWDAHFIEWSSNDINLADSYELGNSITFSSDGLVAGDYTISATVTDNGIPKLSDTAEMTIRVISNVDPAPAASSGGGGSGGGAMLWLLALLSAPLLMGRVRA